MPPLPTLGIDFYCDGLTGATSRQKTQSETPFSWSPFTGLSFREDVALCWNGPVETPAQCHLTILSIPNVGMSNMWSRIGVS